MPIWRKTLRALWGVYPIQDGRESNARFYYEDEDDDEDESREGLFKHAPGF